MYFYPPAFPFHISFLFPATCFHHSMYKLSLLFKQVLHTFVSKYCLKCLLTYFPNLRKSRFFSPLLSFWFTHLCLCTFDFCYLLRRICAYFFSSFSIFTFYFFSSKFGFKTLFAKLRKASLSLVKSVRLSLCLFAWNNSAPVGEILWNLIFELFSKITRESSVFIKIRQE